jgi:thiol-disulfide isomerase/thioredoxin
LHIDISNNNLVFDGEMAPANNFIQKMEKDGMNHKLLANQCLYAQDVDANSVLVRLDSLFDLRKEYIDSSSKAFHLKLKIAKRFHIENEIARDYILIKFPLYYAYRNGFTSLSDVTLPDDYKRRLHFKALVNDNKCVNEDYLENIRSLVSQEAEKQAKASSEEFSDKLIGKMTNQILLDSLSGKTRVYALASQICSSLKYNNELDSIAYDNFKQMKMDKIAKSTVNAYLDIRERRLAMIGQPLNDAFSQTILIDSEGRETSFGDIMASFHGKVVYLDIWATTCYPCRQAMQFAVPMKVKLKDKPVAFVYLSINDNTPDFWVAAEKLSGTSENHYIVKNNTFSKLHTYAQISWVPFYMIFDKEGCLVNFDAPRPSADINNDNSELINILTELVEK